MPVQTGQVLALGGAPKRVEQEQKILVSVLSWAWTSSPMTGSNIITGEFLLCFKRVAFQWVSGPTAPHPYTLDDVIYQ
jgi:hypothetical protein